MTTVMQLLLHQNHKSLKLSKKHQCFILAAGIVLLAVPGGLDKRDSCRHSLAGAAHPGQDQLGRVRAAAASRARWRRRRPTAQLPPAVAVVLQPFRACLATAPAAPQWWRRRKESSPRGGEDYHVFEGRRVHQQRQRAGGDGVGDRGRTRRLHHRQGARRRHQGAATRQVQVVCPDSTSFYLQRLPLELLPDFSPLNEWQHSCLLSKKNSLIFLL
jgi:hypothetical protein